MFISNFNAPQQSRAIQNESTTLSLRVVDVLGLRFHSLKLSEALPLIDQFIRERQPRQITFSNAYTISLCRKNKELRQIINRSHLNLADGMSVVWGARWLGLKIPERVAGPDVMEALCAHAADKGHRVFLMGSSPENLERLSTVLKKRHPGLHLVGTHSPPMSDSFGEEVTGPIIAQLRAAHPDILFVGVSCPKQEKWIAQYLDRLNVPVCLAVGAAFDFLSGRIPRAPRFIRESGLEWLFRLCCQPRRLWRRYLLGNFIFLTCLLLERRRAQNTLP